LNEKKKSRGKRKLSIPEALEQLDQENAGLSDKRKLAAQRARVQSLRKDYREALNVIDDQNKLIEMLTHVDRPRKRVKLRPSSKKLSYNEATAIQSLNDWHVGEVIRREVVGVDNEFNADIFAQRADRLPVNSLKLIRQERKLVPVNNLVIVINGDIFANEIHEELIESNDLTVNQAAELIEDKLVAYLNLMLNHGKFNNITVVFETGNHDRQTMKIRISTETAHSYAQSVCRHVAKLVPDVNWVINDGYYDVLDIYGWKVRVHHGHAIRGGGGIGGVTAPILRQIAKWEPVDWDLIAHFHQFHVDNKFVISNCLCGYNAYAQRIGATFSYPSQALVFVDNKRGRTLERQVWV